ncbi:MAG TPA: VIT domain-containing protein [Geobacteraceae bacterium]|nr:VIT domain-containing protein [Geobacteraceae bacterium]
MRKKWLVPICLAVVALLPPFPARASVEKAEDKTLSPYFFVENGDPSVDRLPLKETNVSVSINGVIAGVTVTQKYVNEGKRPINARYMFPASTRAAVNGMKMTVGNRVVTARIREREAAKAEFVKAKSEGKSASLLEEQRPNVFTMNLANIMPKDEVRIELKYTELLVPTEGTYEFVYPTVAGPRYSNQPESGAPATDMWVKSPYLKEGKTPTSRFSIDLSLSAGMPIREVTSPSHKVDLAWKDKTVAGVSLDKADAFGGNRDFILKYRLDGIEIQSGLMLYKGEKENFFLLMVQPPEKIKAAQILPREYIFILDVSGSMHGFPLDTAKVLIKDLIGGLRPSDKFNLVLFSGASTVMAPTSVPATGDNINRALKLIDAQQGGGGTELAAALLQALTLPKDEGRSRTSIIITDGYIDAERETFSLIGKNLDNTNVFSFGIGSSVNRYFIEGLARAGQGESFVVTKPGEAADAATRFRDYVQSPLLTGVGVKFRGFEVYDVEPSAVPDLFARRPLVLFGKWRGKASGEIGISGKTASGTYVRTFKVSENRPLEMHAPLKYLWARSRIARLSDSNTRADDPGIRKEVTELGLEYSLLTPYTSFIAVIEEIRNRQGASDVDQPQPMPAGVSNLAVGEYSSVPEPGLTALLASMATALLVVSIAAAYLVTLCANTFRIIISIYLYGAPIYDGWVTPERVHCLAGTVVYVTFLMLTFFAVELFMRRCKRPGTHGPLGVRSGATDFSYLHRTLPVPFAWYALVTVLVPLLNGAAGRSGSRFAEHAALVTAAGLFIFIIPASVAAILKKRVDISNKTKEKREMA